MGQPAEDRDAMGEAVAFLGHFKDLPDPRVTGAEPWALGEILLVPTRRGSIQPGCARPG